MRRLRSIFNRIPLTAWLILGLGLRILYAGFQGQAIMAGDAEAYWVEAGKWVQGDGPSWYWPPGLAAILTLFRMLGNTWVWSVLPGLIMYGGIALFLWKKQSPDHGFRAFSQFILAVFPTWLHHTTAPLTQAMVGGCLVFVWGILESEKSGRWKWLGMGLLLGFMILTRPATLGVALIWLALVVKKHGWPSLLKTGLIVLLLWGAWEGYAYAQRGRFLGFAEANTRNLFIGNNPWTPLQKGWWLGTHDERSNPEFEGYYQVRDSLDQLPRLEQRAAFGKMARAYIMDSPALFLHRMGYRMVALAGFDTYMGARFRVQAPWLLGLDFLCWQLLWIMALLSWNGRWKGNARWKGLTLLAFAAPYLLAFAHPVYHQALIPLLMLWTGRGGTFSLRNRSFSWWGIAVAMLIAQLVWALILLNHVSG